MFTILSKPLTARPLAILSGFFLSIAVSIAHAQTLPEIQRSIKQNQLPQALEQSESFIARNPKDPQGQFLKGVVLTEMGKASEAITIFTKLTEDYPELPEPYNNLAVLYAQQKQYDKSRTALEMAIRTHPSYATAHENLGDVYAKLASQAYNKALQLDSSNTTSQTKLSMITQLIGTSTKPSGKDTVRIASNDNKTVPATTKTEKTTEPKVETPTAKPVEAPSKATQKSDPKVTETPTEPTTEKPLAANNSEAEVKKTLQTWAEAWSRKDVKSYLAFYAPDFRLPGKTSRKDWEKERAQRINKPGKLQVSLSDMRVSLEGNKATVRVRQEYTSSTLKSSAGKTLVMVKSNNRWLIQQERVN